MPTEPIRRYSAPARAPSVEERASGAPAVITGYAAVFYRADDPATEYEIYPEDQYGPRIVERIMPGAFDRAIKEDDVRALYNHDPILVLGRTASGTLRLSVDEIGLRYEIDPPETQLARDLVHSLRRGDVSGSSFAFVARGSQFRDETRDGKIVETVVERRDVKLYDVGPVTYPAYIGSSSGLRSADGRAALRSEYRPARTGADLDLIEVTLAGMDD